MKTNQIFMKILSYMYLSTRKPSLNFASHPDKVSGSRLRIRTLDVDQTRLAGGNVLSTTCSIHTPKMTITRSFITCALSHPVCSLWVLLYYNAEATGIATWAVQRMQTYPNARIPDKFAQIAVFRFCCYMHHTSKSTRMPIPYKKMAGLSPFPRSHHFQHPKT